MRSKFAAAILLAATLAACDLDSVPTGDPVADRQPEPRGFVYNADAMSLNEDDFVWAQQGLSGYRRTSASDYPASVGRLAEAGCRFPAPAAGERVLHAHIETGVAPSPIWWVSEDEIPRRAQRIISGHVQQLSRGLLTGMAHATIDRMPVVNVVVTERNGPVYLVLSSEKSVVWNIQAHPEVQITRIAVISGNAAGVANAPASAHVSALAGAAAARCGAYPHRMPRDDWRFIVNARAAGAAVSLDDIIRQNRRDASAYLQWLRENFGSQIDARSAGALAVGNVLLGPLPSEPQARVPYRSLAGADLQVTRRGHFFPGGRKQYEAGTLALVSDALARSGGTHIVDFLRGAGS